MFSNNRDGTFSEVSGPVGLDFIEDSRTFVLADLDHDGRLEVILKNRNAPQLRILHNSMKDIGSSIAFCCATYEQSRCDRNRYHRGSWHSPSDKVSAGRFRFSGPALQRAVLWPRKSGRNYPGSYPLAKRVNSGIQRLPANHRIEIGEGSAEFAAKTLRCNSRGLYAGRPFAVVEPLPSQVGTWLIEPLKAPAFSLPILPATYGNFAHFTAASCCSTFGQQRRHSPSISCGY